MQILETKEVKKYYQTPSGIVRALDGVSLSVTEGTFGAIVGSSGSGKTTLLHMLGGLDEPTDGEVWVRGTSLKEMSGEEKTVFRRRNIGFVFQQYNLIPSLSIRENIVLPMRLDGKEIDIDFFNEIVEILGLKDKLERFPSTLSGGQQQRVSIERALLTKTAIVMADETTGNLDSASSETVMEYLQMINKDLKKAVVLVTHDAYVASFCDRVIFVKDGNIEVELRKKEKQDVFCDKIMKAQKDILKNK